MHRDELPIPAPCDQEWDGMSGGERKRYCERCQHAVHDLSAMTRRQARRLLVKQPRDLCVSYLTNDDGEIQFRPEGSSRTLRGVALGVALGVAACSQRMTGAPVPERAMGAPALPAATTSASAASSTAVPAESAGQDCEVAAPPSSAPSAAPSHAPPPPSIHRTAGKPMPRKSDSKDPLR